MPINRLALMLGTGLLSLFSCVNLFASLTPNRDQNQTLANMLIASTHLPLKERLLRQTVMRAKQTALLIDEPTDPYAWMRLAYLRRTTQGDAKSAFMALRFSDYLSPNEENQMWDRVRMWRSLAEQQNAKELSYQNALWRKALFR